MKLTVRFAARGLSWALSGTREGGLRARRSAEQDSLGDRLGSGPKPNGGTVMVKNVLSKAGRKTALVVIGWIAFFAGVLSSTPTVSIPLMAIARVLP